MNQKDRNGRNIFQGGFLGLDNIGVFDRSAQLPPGCYINQSDGTSWMAMYALNLMRIALELAQDNHVYEDIASKFFEHFLNIAGAMAGIYDHGVGLWDEEDQFFYDVLTLSSGDRVKLRIRSMVGLIPLFAVETLEPELLDKAAGLPQAPGMAAGTSAGSGRPRILLAGTRPRTTAAAVPAARPPHEKTAAAHVGRVRVPLRSRRALHVARALRTPLRTPPQRLEPQTVRYTPAESDGRQFGGNSNWRGPIWFPVNFLIIESLQKFHHYYGDDFKVECPTGSGKFFTPRRGRQRIVAPPRAAVPERRRRQPRGPAPVPAIADGSQ